MKLQVQAKDEENCAGEGTYRLTSLWRARNALCCRYKHCDSSDLLLRLALAFIGTTGWTSAVLGPPGLLALVRLVLTLSVAGRTAVTAARLTWIVLVRVRTTADASALIEIL